MAKNSQARIKASNKYVKKAYKQFNVKLKPYQMEILENHCNRNNYSKNNFAVLSIQEKIERETGKTFEELLKETEQSKSSD